MQDNKETLNSKIISKNCEKTVPLIKNNILIGINRSLDAGMKNMNPHQQKEHYQNALLLSTLHENLGNKKMKLVDILNTKTSFIVVAALCTASLVYIFN